MGATALLLGVISLSLFSWGIQNPRAPYYDEPQYIAAAQAFWMHAPNPNPEAPPMGKLLIALSMKAFGDTPWGWRSAGVIFGALIVVGIFFWMYLLLDSYSLALTAAALTLLDNFLFVMARVAMMDVFLVAFTIWGLSAFTAAIRLRELSLRARRALVVFAGILFGFACACKWNGVDTPAVLAMIAAGLFVIKPSADEETRDYQSKLRSIGLGWLATSLSIVPVTAYSLTFWPLCRSIHQRFSLPRLMAMNAYIWRFHRAVVGNPSITSAWYSWPLQVAPQRGLSYLVGNWFIMWTGLLALLFCCRRFLIGFPETLVVLLYAGNLLQWALTPQSCLYYYYYFPAALFLGAAIPIALSRLPSHFWRTRLSAISIACSAYIFLFCYAQMAHLGAPFDSILGYWS